MAQHADASQAPEPSQTVVVTFKQVEKILTNAEALGHLNEVSRSDNSVAEADRKAILDEMARVLEEIREAESTAGAEVLSSPHDEASARLQSLIASGEAARLELAPLPGGALEAVFDTHDWSGWATVLWQKLKHRTPHPMARPNDAVPSAFPRTGRIAVLGDWGTGLYGAPKIAETVRKDSDPYAMVLHLGDVYYSGTRDEVKARFLNVWPARNGTISRALNSNHEMYSGGFAYFDDALPRFGQQGSYFATQNEHWTIVGLDTGYTENDIDAGQADWIKAILAQAGDRKVVFFSHHQLYSSLEPARRTRLWERPGLADILRSRQIYAWYWGHEHRCTIFEEPDSSFGILGRCMGHGGMPQSRRATKGLPRASGQIYDRADWRICAPRTVGGMALPPAAVLEGRNEFIEGEEDKFTPHGYAVLTFDGPHLREQVMTPRGEAIYDKLLR